MRRLFLALAAPLILLTGCASLGTPPPGPAAVADTTIGDERAALGVEVMYQGWRTSVTTGVQLGLIRGQTAARVQELDKQIWAAVGTARRAYDAGQATTYASASAQVASLIAQAMSVIKGAT